MMTSAKRAKTDWELEEHYAGRVRQALGPAPWVLRITEHSDKPPPVLFVKERVLPNGKESGDDNQNQQPRLEDRGVCYGPSLRRCLPVLRAIVGPVTDDEGVPFELERFLAGDRIAFRGNLPLDAEAGPKLALIFKLTGRLKDLDRDELIARRVERFTREEAAYWHSRMTNFGEHANRWARAGMRTMLGGQPGDPAVEVMLERLRSST